MMHNSVDTVNAAAVAIVTAESRVQQVVVPRRRWADCFNVYWCFGSHRNGKRISNAVLVPEPAVSSLNASAPENANQLPAARLPFIVPPSSPSSFLQSGSPSATQSLTGPLSLSTLSANSYSPRGPASIFAIGPYAHETQLVSPPVFSTFTTEPSTAPFTPPPEPVHLTTPSSPEVPFAKLLTSSLNSNCKNETYGFQSYQLYPGSPIGHLISPSSVCSGTSSPFPDVELHSSGGSSFPSFPVSEPQKILNAKEISAHKLVARHARNGGSLLDGQISAAVPIVDSSIRSQSNEHVIDQRVSFELTAEDVLRCLGKKAAMSGDTNSEFFSTRTDGSRHANHADNSNGISIDETYHDLPLKIQKSLALPTVKDFKFGNADAAQGEHPFDCDWCVSGKTGTQTEQQKRWAFFPMI